MHRLNKQKKGKKKNIPSNSVIININLPQAFHHLELVISTLGVVFLILFPNLEIQFRKENKYHGISKAKKEKIIRNEVRKGVNGTVPERGNSW